MWVALAIAVGQLGGARFEAHGQDVGEAILSVTKADERLVAAGVRRHGFFSGAPVGAGECAGCHQDVAAQWGASAHRFSSFNNPYYRVSVDAFRREKGFPSSRFCGGCHEPSVVATGAMDRKIDRGSPPAQSGVTCLVCHSIARVDLEGNGRYLADLRPISLDKGPHGARLRPALLAESRVCAACHKVGLGPEITGDRWLRGQNDYDAWQASAIAGNGAASVYRPERASLGPKRCQDCHMPLEPAVLGDKAAKNGLIRSHRFPGANTALPHLRGDDQHEARTATFLRGTASLALVWSAPDRIDAVLRARGVGHRMPGGTMDSNEVWLEVTAYGDRGQVLGRSGGLGADGAIAPGSHLVRAQPVAGDGRPLLRRDPQHMRGVAFDAALTPSDPQVVRFEVPPDTTRVTARLLYRKFSAAYARLACADVFGDARRRCRDLPVTEIAAAALAAGAPAPSAVLLDWGLALADAPADHAAEALAPLTRARALAPARVEPVLALGRLALKLGQTDEVATLANQALALAPHHPAPLLQLARSLLDAYRFPAARSAAERLAARLPGDRTALALLARARGLTGDPAGALEVADRILIIDPESEEGHYQRAVALEELGRSNDARAALARYDEHRVTQELDLTLRRRWRALHPESPDESEPCHTHVVRLSP